MSAEPIAPAAPLTFVTGNANKVREVQAILSAAGIAVKARDCPGLIEIQAPTLEEIATDKCRRAAAEIKGPVLIEDTALCFNALKGLPGAYVKWFLTSLGPSGLERLLAGHDDKSAEAVCTFAYCGNEGQEVILFQGRVQGKIVPPRGENRFGWDPIFEYQGQTFSEMEPAAKNKISHRSIALAKLQDWMEKQAKTQR